MTDTKSIEEICDDMCSEIETWATLPLTEGTIEYKFREDMIRHAKNYRESKN